MAPVAMMGLYFSQDVACDYLPEAFSRGVTTETSDPIVGVANRCEVTKNSDGSTIGKTVVNWSGLVGASALLVGAWFFGAGIAKRISPRTAAAGVALALGAGLIAIAAWFI